MLSTDLVKGAALPAHNGDFLSRNGLLAQLSPHVRQRIASVATRGRVDAGAQLPPSKPPFESVCFIEEGVVALVGDIGDGRGEVGLTGRDGMIGALDLVLGRRRTCLALAQTDCVFSEVDADSARLLMEQEPELREVVTTHAADLMEQLVRVSVCHSSHSLLQRVAAWIEAVDGHLADGTLEITHRQIAGLVCARRATVTEILHILEGDGAIRSRRGSLSIRDRTVLAKAACGCRRHREN